MKTYSALLLCCLVGFPAFATVTQDDVNTAKHAYEEVRQSYAAISRAARVIQETNVALWKYVRELEKQNAALVTEVDNYKNLVRSINSNLARHGNNNPAAQ